MRTVVYISLLFGCLLVSCRKQPDPLNLANEKAREGKYQQAIDLYTEAIAKSDTDFYAFMYRGMTKMRIADTTGAMSDYRVALELRKDHTVYALMGDVYYAKGQFPRAKEYYRLAADLNPDGKANDFYNTALAKERAGESIAAMFDYERAVGYNTNLTEALYNKARVKQELGDYKSALADYNELLRLDTRFAAGYFNRGLLHVAFENFDRAKRDFSVAIELDPTYADSYMNRGNLRFREKQYESALQDYNEAIQLDSLDARSIYGRALTKYILGDHTSALSDFDRSIQLEVFTAAQYFHRGSIKKIIGDVEGALQDYGAAGGMGYMLAFDSIQLTNDQLAIEGINEKEE